MQLTAALLLVFSLSLSARSVSQTVSLKGKNISYETIFKEIEKQTGYYVVTQQETFDRSRRISVNVTDMEISEFIKTILGNGPYQVEIKSKTIFIKQEDEKKALNEGPKISDVLEVTPIKGLVRDTAGTPLSGATVMNKRTRKSVQTNAKGEFALEADPGDILQVSFVGYQQKEIKVSGNTVFVLLNFSNSPLDEVQVQAYGTTTKRTSTSTIYTVTSEDIAKQPVDNPLYALQGRVPNLIITPSSGLPGAPVKLQLRGQNSLARVNNMMVTTQPLILIDGVPFNNNIPGAGNADGTLTDDELAVSALSFVNPKDIQSIDVLADADATAIYGSRGGNGVILITTKRGRKGDTRINLSSSVGFNEVTSKLDLLNTQEYLAMRKEAYANDEIPFPTEPDQTNYDLTVWDQNRYTDWQERFFGKRGWNQNINASVSGGSATIQYLLSGTYSRQSYVFPGNNQDKTGSGYFSLTGTSSNSKLQATLSGSYSANSRLGGNLNFVSRAISLSPNAPEIYKQNGELNWEPDPLTGLGTWDNPHAQLLQTNAVKTKTIYTNVDISYRLLQNLTLRTTAGLSENRLNSIALAPLSSYDPETAALNFITGTAVRNNNTTNSWTFDPQIAYTPTVGKSGKLDILAGASFQKQSLETQFLLAGGYTTDALLNSLASAAFIMASNATSQYKYAAAFGRIGFNWNAKYMLSINGRRDGSSRFGPVNKFGNFGSIGLGWIFSEENILKSMPFLSFGKLRMSYGSSGNDGIGDYGFLELYRVANFFPSLYYQGVIPIISLGATNPYYSWESIKKAELGFELGFLKDRILLNFAYWRSRSSDQLGTSPLPATAGNTAITFNQPAKIQNMGFDLVLNTANVKSKSFSWSTVLNIGIARNKLLAMPAGFNGGGITYGYPSTDDAIGQPFAGIVPVYQYLGVDPATGLYQFANAEGKPTSDPSQIIDNRFNKRITVRPDYTGGISNRFTWMGFALDIFIQFSKHKSKNYLFDGPFIPAGGYFEPNATGNQPKAVLSRWQNPGDISDGGKFTQKSLFDESPQNNYLRNNFLRFSDAAWVDGSFIRIKNVSFSYSIPESMRKKLKIQDLRIYVQAQNLFTFTEYDGFDPETQNVSALPPLRTIVSGISLTF